MPISATDIRASYKIRARGMDRCPDKSVCRMEISIGQPYHEGEKLASALQWAERFDRVHLLMGDSPQRYNLMFEQAMPEAAAERIARARGDEWLARNSAILGRHSRFEISRWNDWKHRKDYITTRWQIGRLYRDHAAFRDAIDAASRETFTRRAYTGWDAFAALSREYLLEESAVFALAYNELGGFSAYPGSFLDTWDMFTANHIPEAPAGFGNAHHAVIGFDRLKA